MLIQCIHYCGLPSSHQRITNINIELTKRAAYGKRLMNFNANCLRIYLEVFFPDFVYLKVRV